MKSKSILFFVAGCLTLVLIMAGTFSAGVAVGTFIPQSNTSNVIATPSVPTPTDQGSAQPPPTSAGVPTEETGPATTAPPENTPVSVKPVDLQDLFAPFWEAWGIVHDQFVDQPLDDEALIRGAVDGMLEALKTSNYPRASQAIPDFASQTGTPEDLQDEFNLFWVAWQNAHGTVDDVTLMQGAITGMMDALGDQHSSYMDPDQFTQANIPLDGEYEGIGAWVDPDGEFLTIVSPMPGSPAEEAGLKPGDQVIKVDGEDMTGIDGNLVIRRVLGPAGSKVVLTIRREGEPELLDFTITRAKITIPSVTGKMLDGEIAYVELITFGESTDSDLRDILSDLLAQNPKGLILDLRNNGGGFLNTAIQVASEFIDEGVIMYENYGDGTRDTYKAIRGGLATDIPMVVLINEGSASASEIVAGAIQDHDRGLLVGTTSFGKGSVQNWVPLSNNQGAIRVTIARWFTPDNRQIHGIGLDPDVPVELTADDFEANRDPQLDKAIELLSTP